MQVSLTSGLQLKELESQAPSTCRDMSGSLPDYQNDVEIGLLCAQKLFMRTIDLFVKVLTNYVADLFVSQL